jgi:hypothetical protein
MSIANRDFIKQSHAANGNEKGSRELNNQLYPLVAAGDKQAAQQMVERNIPLVISKVDDYIFMFPDVAYLRDDLVSEGNLGLCIAVDKMAEKGPVPNPNPTGYISYWIQYRLGTVVDAEQANGASSRTIALKAEKGEIISKQVSGFNVYAHDGEEQDPTALIELMDEIEGCCESEEELTIVRMRARNHVDQEIAQAINTPLSTTYMLRRGIYKRFLERTGMKGEV